MTAAGGSGLFSETTTYTWSLAGRLQSASSSLGTRTFGHDAQGRVTSVDDSRAGLTTFTLDEMDRVSAVERDTGTTVALAYTALGRLLAVTTSDGGAVLDTLALARGSDGWIEQVTDAEGDHALGHDDRARLVSVDRPATSALPSEGYTLDANGNRLAWTGHAETEVVLDADLLLGDAAYDYTYDEEGRLATRASHGDGTATTMAYDPLGRRVQVVHDGTTAMFVHDGAEARAVLGVAGALERWWATDPGGGLLAEVDVATGTVRDALLDHLGTRRGWVTAGTVELDPADALGNRAAGTPSRVEPAGLTWHQQDPTGLVYARARYLDPATGRFLSEDPLAAENAYTYAASSPYTAWDPWGLAAAVEYGALNKKEAISVESRRELGIQVACQLTEIAAQVAGSCVVEAAQAAACARSGPKKAPIHHIATNKNSRRAGSRGAPWTPMFEDLFDKAGVSMNDPLNLVPVPGHKGSHPQAYHEEVYDRLVEGLTSGGSGGFSDALAGMRSELLTPGSGLLGKLCGG